jgi:hypothetical protein
VLEDKIVLPTTMGDGAAAYEVEANFTLRGLFAGLVSDSRTVELCPGRMASPRGSNTYGSVNSRTILRAA